jgi:hypothetical protein
MIILRTGKPNYTRNAYLSGMSILNRSGRLSSPDRVSAMALEALTTMRGRTQKVNTVDDRVAVIIENIKTGEKSALVHVFAGQRRSPRLGRRG